jgi:hypothetical protein
MPAIAWILTLYAVGTNAEVWRVPHQYATEAWCLADGKAIAKPGVTYPVCTPIETTKEP